jgi:5-methylcytosine-specific restriction endonuclease McrA
MSRVGCLGSVRRRKQFQKLHERHGDNCHWCGKPMDFETRDEPLSATIEHLIPKSEGGPNAQTNLRLAHKLCNNERNRMMSHPLVEMPTFGRCASRRSGLLRTEPLRVSAVPEPAAIARCAA